MKYRKLPVIIEAITFDELVKYGDNSAIVGINGTSIEFIYNGHRIHRKNEYCYFIPTLEGVMEFTKNDMLITGINGEIYPCKSDIFNKTYELVE
jgi:hypothetical protein